MTPETLADVMEATWPPARKVRLGPWWLREGAGGGQRVSAASAAGAWRPEDIPQAEAAMEAMGQGRLWVIHEDEALDAALAARGYRRHDPVVAYAAPVAQLAGPVSGMAAFCHWPPLAITCDVWAEGGIGPARVAVMERVTGRKTAILGRSSDTPSGAGFVARQKEMAPPRSAPAEVQTCDKRFPILRAKDDVKVKGFRSRGDDVDNATPDNLGGAGHEAGRHPARAIYIHVAVSYACARWTRDRLIPI